MADFLSIKDAARRLGVKPKEVRRRIKDGELDGFVRVPAAGGDGGAFGPSAPNRRAAPPPERDAHVQRLEETVLVLQGELNTRRQEAEELNVLLREIKDSLPATAPSPPQDGATPPGTAAPPAMSVPGNDAPVPPSEPEIDWNAYEAESEQLRATMGRLEALLEQLDEPEPEPELGPGEPAAAPKVESAPALAAQHAPRDQLSPPRVATPVSATEPGQEPAGVTVVEAAPAARGRRPATATPKPAASTSEAPSANEPPTGDALSRRREKIGVSREALAAFARISWGFVTEVEGGRRKDPRSRQRLVTALDAWQKRLDDERAKAQSAGSAPAAAQVSPDS